MKKSGEAPQLVPCFAKRGGRVQSKYQGRRKTVRHGYAGVDVSQGTVTHGQNTSVERRGEHAAERRCRSLGLSSAPVAERGGDVEGLRELAELSAERAFDESLERILVTAREQLGMEIAFVSEFTGGQQVYRVVEGDGGSFSIEEGEGLALEATFCQRLVEGELTNIVPDARRDERVRDLDVTREADIGSYVGVPLRFSDGRLYGTMCCMSHSPDPSLRERDVDFMRVLARLVAESLEREELRWRSLQVRVKATGVEALLAALEARDGYTGEHSEAVVDLALAVTRRLGLPEERIPDVEQAAMLHDIGKIGVPDAILNKPGPLDEREWSLMREHPAIGERIVSSIESLAHVAPVIRAEHERWDGKGYPDGLSGERIPLISRIVLACDSFHAMVSDRPYRRAMHVREALQEINRNIGTQFCPTVGAALVELIEETYLSDGSG